GWVTAEYSMLPRCAPQRIPRERRSGGRTHEIQRLIGRSLRAIVDMEKLGERTIIIDCDVIQADGGTRTASITGAYIALCDTIAHLKKIGAITEDPIIDSVAATSVGILEGTAILDLDYVEDSTAEVDMNIVMTGSGKFIEVQGTAESAPFGKDKLTEMLAMAEDGISKLTEIQKDSLSS
ncbi:MAG: ribonuclease PH, partial [Deltaproteobacteria bacterium]|nr:ribonuclease PH [Deltaproteobacteria bacterium]